MIKLPLGFGIVDRESLENLKQQNICQKNLIDSQKRLISAQASFITGTEKLLVLKNSQLQLKDEQLRYSELCIKALQL